MRKSKDWRGSVIGRLTVLFRFGAVRYGKGACVNPRWVCQCACGAYVYRISALLQRASVGKHDASCNECLFRGRSIRMRGTRARAMRRAQISQARRR